MIARVLACAFVVGLVVSCASLTTAQAATITSIASSMLPGFSTGSIGSAGFTPAPNNDNAVGASANVIPYSIFFNAGGVGVMEVEYIAADSGGTTEYRFTQSLINNTGQVWRGLRLELGYGTGAAFVRSGAADALDFDWPERDPAPTSTRFVTLNHATDVLTWTGGTVPSIGSTALTFAIDVPDGLAALHPAGLNRFTLRQIQLLDDPVRVPEPAAVALLAFGALAARPSRRRRAFQHDLHTEL